MIKLQRTLKKVYAKANYLYIIVIFIVLILLLKCKYPSTKTDDTPRSTRGVEGLKKEQKPKLQCYLFILIMTSPKGNIKRQAMRETWLKTKVYSNMVVVSRFIIGMKDLPRITQKEIMREQKQYSDLHLLVNHKDSYQALTMKLLKSFVWIRENVDAKFVMKVDDDSFVRLDKLLPSLQERQSIGHIYWGFFRGSANVKRTGPWKEEKWFLSDHYLPYALGGGYVISFDLLEYLWKNADWITQYNSEDVSLGKTLRFSMILNFKIVYSRSTV